MKRFSLLIGIIFLLCTVSCAQGPDSSSPSGSGSSGSSGSSKRFINFFLRINDGGRVSTGGYYVILLNSQVEAIEVTNPGTYTDAIRLYMDPVVGPTHNWLHRIPSVPGPGYEFVITSRLDEYASISSDWKSITYTFNTTDPSVIFNQYMTNRFTAHAMTTDTYHTAILGRALDTLGPGPDTTHNDLYSILVDKQLGPQNPLPPDYPSDPLYDWATKGDLPADFNYVNFDIESFQINTY
jgi:hypothetical protein